MSTTTVTAQSSLMVWAHVQCPPLAISLRQYELMQALYIHWMCTNVYMHFSYYFVLSRCFEVLPAGAPWAVNDIWTLQWLDPGLQVCISCNYNDVVVVISVVTMCFSFEPDVEVFTCSTSCFLSNVSSIFSVVPAASKIKTRDCRLSSTPVRNYPQPTTTTLSESLFPCFTPCGPLLGPVYFITRPPWKSASTLILEIKEHE